MEKYLFDKNSDIFLFSQAENKEASGSSLNEFLQFLKFNRVSIPYKFTYVSAKDSLIPDLTLKQNLLLDYTIASLTEEKEVHFKNFLKNKANVYLEALYGMIVNINDIPSNATAEEIKIICLMKAIITEAPFIFLESPEKDLSFDAFKLFQKALQYQLKNQTQTVFITTPNESIWNHLISKKVHRGENQAFIITDNSYRQKMALEKMEFFHPKKEEAKLEELKFHLPNKLTKKKAS